MRTTTSTKTRSTVLTWLATAPRALRLLRQRRLFVRLVHARPLHEQQRALPRRKRPSEALSLGFREATGA